MSVDAPFSIATRIPDATVDQPYAHTLTATGGLGAYTWLVFTGQLPPGLSLNPATGELSGTPLTPFYGSVVFSVTDEYGRAAYEDLAIQVAEPLALTTAAMPNGLRESPYNEAMRVAGGVGPYTYSYVGQLPAGLSLNTSTGVVSGTPTATGYTNVQYSVTDSTWPTPQTSTQTLGMRVTSVLTILTSQVFQKAKLGEAINPLVLSAAGGPSPYTWAQVGGFLPEGITLNPANGTLSGTPLADGDYVFSLQVTDSLGATTVKEFFWHVSDTLRVATFVIPDAALGEPYHVSLAAVGGLAPYSWRLVTGTLPAGISFNTATGTLSGTPTATQTTTSFTVEVIDADSPAQTAQRTYTIQVLDELAITTAALANGREAEAYSATIHAALGSPPYSWRLESGALPPGLTLTDSPTVATLDGVPTTAGTYTFTLEVSDSGTPVQTVTRAYTVEIYDAVVIETTGLASAYRGVPYSGDIVVTGGELPYRFQLTAGSLPTGLVLNPATGRIEGTANEVVGHASTFTVRVADAGNPQGFATFDFVLHVIDPLSITTELLPAGKQGLVYYTGLEGTGGVSPHTWALAAGSSLPTGLGLDAATGALSGTPEVCGAFDLPVTLTDAAQLPNTAVRTYTLDVQCQTGFLTVTLEPPQAVTDGARWSVDGGATWQASGQSVELPVGTHTVSFQTAAGWTAPATQDVQVAADATTPLTATYGEVLPVASIYNAPAGSTNQTGATLTVGGTAVVAYRYDLDGAGYGAETPTATPITLSGLGAGDHTVAVIGRNSAGTWQLEADAATATWTIVAEALHWDGVVYTPFVADYFGTVTVDGVAAEVGDEVAAFDPQGNPCGHTVVSTQGTYGLLHVYGDDPTTPAVDEGAEAGDTLTFKVWSVSAQKEYGAVLTVVSGMAQWFAGEQNEVDLNGVDRVTVPLRAGWNLVSFPAATCWEKGDAPSVALPTGTSHQTVTSIADVFTSIAGKYTVVRSFDAAGAHTFDPNLPDFFNDLTYVAGGYGYWVKMLEDADLVLQAAPLAPTAALNLSTGWNLVGYWGSDCRHVGAAPSDHFPAGTAFTPVDSIADVVPGLAGNLIVLRSFDAAGAHTYDPTLPDFFNDLTYLGPGYGYWVKVGADGELVFDAP